MQEVSPASIAPSIQRKESNAHAVCLRHIHALDLSDRLRRRLTSERGQGTIEYVGLILLVSLLMVGMVAAMKGFNNKWPLGGYLREAACRFVSWGVGFALLARADGRAVTMAVATALRLLRQRLGVGRDSGCSSKAGTFVGDRRHSLVAQSGLRASEVSTSR
jgi:hypothetical protein